MKNFAKAALIALTATSMTVPAYAASFSVAGSTRTGTGTLNADSPKGNHNCTINTIDWTFSSSLITLTDTAMTGTNCSDAEGSFQNIEVQPVSTSSVNLVSVDFQAPFGLCQESNVGLGFSGGTASGSNIGIGWLCYVNSVSVTLNSAVSINP